MLLDDGDIYKKNFLVQNSIKYLIYLSPLTFFISLKVVLEKNLVQIHQEKRDLNPEVGED